METEKMNRYHFVFSGRVQHVGFRYMAQYTARSLKLTGRVANMPDGRVDMEVQGREENIWKLIGRLKDDRYIRIENYTVEALDVKEAERDFIR